MGKPLEGYLIWAMVSPDLHPYFTVDNPSQSIFMPTRFMASRPGQSKATSGNLPFLSCPLCCMGPSPFTAHKLSPGGID